MDQLPKNCSLPRQDVGRLLEAHQLLISDGASPIQPAAGYGVLRTDSRQVQRGDIFLAYAGVRHDSHNDIASAIAAGAGLVVCETRDWVASINYTGPWLLVKSGRAAWSWLAAESFGNPQNSLDFLGVTGTNGKSSTVWMIGQLLQSANIPYLTLGTLGAYYWNGGATQPQHLPTSHTTPDPDQLFAYLAGAVAKGIRVVAMEVSSHALIQEKIAPLTFLAGALTSFSRDHLDFHGSMEAYWQAKWLLFSTYIRKDGRCVFWDGLPRQPDFTQVRAEAFVYGMDASKCANRWGIGDYAQIQIEDTTLAGTRLALQSDNLITRATIPYFADHALQNFAAASLLAGKAAGTIFAVPNSFAMLPVPGRLEQVKGSTSAHPCVVVDYAHTPDALEKTLDVLRAFCTGRLIVVFGCGGDRDRGKRPMMGRIAAMAADRVVITSDNPRTEPPASITAEILVGAREPQKSREHCEVILDRKSAIAAAIASARTGDLVVIAGKGHETYQILGTLTVPFDDRLVASQALCHWQAP